MPMPKVAGAVSPGMNSVNTSQAPGGPAQQSSAPGPPPSWAAAAGKGLPNNDNSSSSASGPGGSGASQNSTSKHLESLQSVREALFSQDGWGGDNVKQDNAWDMGGNGGSASSSSAPSVPTDLAQQVRFTKIVQYLSNTRKLPRVFIQPPVIICFVS